MAISVVNGFLSAKYLNKAREMEISHVFSVPSAISAVEKNPPFWDSLHASPFSAEKRIDSFHTIRY
jgi:hypothetical protein